MSHHKDKPDTPLARCRVTDIEGTMPDLQAPAPVDIAAVRLPPKPQNSLRVEPVLAMVPVRRPERQEYFRVSPEEDCRLCTRLIDLKREREHFLVDAALWSELHQELTYKMLVLCVNREGQSFLWPIKLPDSCGRLDPWNQSAQNAAHVATSAWVRISANMQQCRYDVMRATGDLKEPQWPEQPFAELINIAFQGRYITSLEHPVVKQLRGAQ